MAATDSTPFFSVIISTRNRPSLFFKALQSVMRQTFQDREIIVVVDGSDEPHLASYQQIAAEHPDIRFIYVEHRPAGHGQSYSMNVGSLASHGKYLSFLDDDDYWTSDTHLEQAANCIQAAASPIELYLTNQLAYFADNTRQTKKVWLEDLIEKVTPRMHHLGSSYLVDTAFLIGSSGFSHMNCTIVSRPLYDRLGGMDESIRYENDRDFYIRAIDTASGILFSTDSVSRHNIPDTSKRDNMSTVASGIEKKLYQMRVYDKGICTARQAPVINFCRRGKTYELKHIAHAFAELGEYRRASHYAKEAVITGFNLRWLAYTCYLVCRTVFEKNTSAAR